VREEVAAINIVTVPRDQRREADGPSERNSE
jgi:hypothetical protein